MKLSFIIPNMKGGGAERVLLNLINKLADYKDDYTIHLVLVKKEGHLLGELNNNIFIYDFNKNQVRYCLFDLIRYLKTEKPNYLISSLDYMNITSSLAHSLSSSNSKLFLWEHNNLSVHSKKTISKSLLLNKIIIKYFYSRANKIIAVSNGVRDDLINNFNFISKKVEVVENPVYNNKIIEKSHEKDENVKKFKNKYIIAVGRLAKQKNYFNLIDAYKILTDKNVINNINLVIVGEGPEEENINARIKYLHLEDKINLVGHKNNPFPLIKGSSAFILSSDNEGLPTVLIEALALKKQIVSTDCPSGPREILDDGKYGILVPTNDSIKLAYGIDSIINKKIIFDEESLLHRAKDFSINNSIKKFKILLNVN